MKKSRIIAGITAITLALAGLCGCGEKTSDVGKSNELKWYIFDNPANTNAQDVYAKANEMILEKTGANVTFVPVESGDYEAKMNILNATGEQMDIVFTSNWCNNYSSNVAKGMLLPLDELLEATPDLYNTIPDYLWEGSKLNGKIYAVPNQQISARESRLIIPEQNIKLLGLDMEAINSRPIDYKTYLSTADEYLRLVYEKTGEYVSCSEFWRDGLSAFALEEIVGVGIPGAVRYGDEGLTVINQYETQEFIDYINTRRGWVEEGLIQSTAETDRPMAALGDDTKVLPILGRLLTYTPGVEAECLKNNKYYPITLARTKGMLTSGGVTSTMTGISATSKNPELALKVIEYVNTDPEIYNLLAFGIEGENYEKISENKIRKIENQTYEMPNWALGNTFISYILENEVDDKTEATKKINDEAEHSVLLGFNPDLNSLKTQVAACTAAVDEYLNALDAGLVDVNVAYPEFMKKLEAAGADEVIAELQKQVDAWKNK